MAVVSDLMRAYKTITTLAPQYEEADNYASGRILEVMTMSRLGKTLRQSDIHFNPNVLATVIDAVNNKLLINSLDAGSATDAVDDIWDKNELGLEAPEIHRHALQRGDQYVTVWPDAETGQPNIVSASPQTTHIFYRSDNPRVKDFAARCWTEEAPDKDGVYIRVNLYYLHRIERYITTQAYRSSAPKQDVDFEPYEDDDDGLGSIVPNPYDEIPVFHFRTARPYGEPEHYRGYGPQDGINKLIIYMMVATEFQGFNQRYVLSEAPGTVVLDEDPLSTLSPQNILDDLTGSSTGDALNDTDAEHRANETGGKLEAGPGGTWWLPPGIKDVGEFATADPANFLEPIFAFVKLTMSTTQTPIHYFEGDVGGPPSGESRRLADGELNNKAMSRRRSFTKTWQEIFGFCAKILGLGEDVNVELTWAPLEQTDTMDMWEMVQLKIEVGMDPVDAFVQAGVPLEKAEAYAQGIKEKQQQELDMQKQEMQLKAAAKPTSAPVRGKSSAR